MRINVCLSWFVALNSLITGVLFEGICCGQSDQSAEPAIRADPSEPSLSPLDQLARDLDVARQVAEQGSFDSSLNAARRALMAGAQIAQPVPEVPSDAQLTSTPVHQLIADRIQAISEVWTERRFPPDQVYSVLLSAVLPAGAPREIRLMPQPVLGQSLQTFAVSPNFWSAPVFPECGSVGQLLAVWAVKAGRQQELRERLAPLAAESETKLPAEVLLGHLALAEHDDTRAATQLTRIGKLLEQNASPAAAELACLVALPALSNEATRAAATDVLDRVIEQVAPTVAADGANVTRLAALIRIQARMQFALGRDDKGRAALDRFLAVNSVLNNLFGGDYPQYLRRQQLGVVMLELLRAGDVAAALDRLGELEDLPAPRNYGPQTLGGYAARLARELTQLPAEERYSLLLDFTLPAGERRGVRLVTEFVPVDRPPADFAVPGVLEQHAFQLPASGNARDVFCTGSLLIQTAREAGQLADLRAALRPLAEQGQLNAAELMVLLDLEEGRIDEALPSVQQIAASIKPLLENAAQRPPYPMLTHLVAAESARFTKLQPIAESMLLELVRYTQLIQNDLPRAHARWSLDLVRRARLANADDEPFAASLPRHWIAAGYENAEQHAAGSLPSVWVVQDGLINKLSGPDQSFLFFRYPLTGEFEVHVDATDGGWNEGNLSYGGVLMDVAGYRKGVSFVHLGERGREWLEGVPWLFTGRFNRQGVRVARGTVQFRANRHPLHAETLTGSPWLALNADTGRTPVFANFRITGEPVIPREVPLLVDERLTGWITDFYGETRPESVPSAQATALRSGQVVGAPSQTADFDWSAKEGVLHGKRLRGITTGPLQSRAYYQRPLTDGEQVSYEYFYAPHAVEAHPALGRLAFLIEPDGVALHWLTDGDADATGLPSDNRIVLPEERRVPAPLPLVVGDWNRVTLAVHAGVARLSLNGVDVYEHVLDAANDRLFGFFHDRSRTSLQVRNLVLTGDWPERLTPDLLAGVMGSVDADASQAEARALNVIIGETRWADVAYDVYRQSLTMPLRERYEYLLDWVMPGPTHHTIRTYAATTPANPPPPLADANPVDVARLQDKLRNRARRVESGGNLVAPAIELIHVAAELKRLDELAQQLDRVDTPALFHTRSRIALLVLVALAQGRPDDARGWMIELYALAKQEPGPTLDQRWVDLIAADAAILHPVTRDVAIDLMDYIVRQQLQAGRPGPAHFDSQVRRIRGVGWALREGTEPGQIGSTPLTQWTIVSQSRAVTNGSGWSTPHWQGRPGQLLHYAGHDADAVYFQSPLSGNYQIDCRLSSFGWRETRVAAAGLWTGILYQRDRYELGHARARRPNGILPQPLAPIESWYDYRLSVQNGVYSSLVGAQPLHTEQLPLEPDPWVDVNSPAAYFGGVCELRITGDPAIPDAIGLLSLPDLSNWTDYYDPLPAAPENSAWRVEGDELVDNQQPQLAGQQAERLLRYHRPMLEDGQIEYEYWYEPGVADAHPALDRIVFLLDPAGVHLHWATDAQFDRTGLEADHVIEESDRRRGPDQLPLRPREWNQVKLAVTGDSVSLMLNGIEVYQRPIEPTNLRFFGLFHFADQSTLRVRNIVYRGAWARELPPVNQQELAANPVGRPESDTHQPQQEFAFDFRDSRFDPGALEISGNSLGAYVFPETAGLRMSFPPGAAKPLGVGVGPSFGLRGDFDILARFEGLSITPPAEAWGAGVEVDALFNSPYDHRAQFELRSYPGDRRVVSTALHDLHVDRSAAYQKDDFHTVPQAGTLWLSRRHGVLRYALATDSSSDCQLLSERYVGHDDVATAQARIVSSDAAGGADVVWKSLVVRADEFLFDARTQPAPSNQLAVDLSRESLGGFLLQVPEPGSFNFVQRTRTGVWMRTPPGQTSLFGVRAVTNAVRLEGDFEVTAEFELAQLAAPASGYGAGVQLRLDLGDPEQHMLHLCRRAYPDGRQGLAVHNVWQVGDARQDDAVIVPASDMAGRMRIVRRGERVTWSFSPAGSNQFEELKSADVGRAPVQAISLVCESSHPATGIVDVIWKSLSIRAGRIWR